jgi:polyphosphate kinase 2 (PPK2 family)
MEAPAWCAPVAKRGLVMKENSKQANGGMDWLEAELADTLDEDYELELSEPAMSEEIRRIYSKAHPETIDRHTYFHELLRLQSELIKLQDWVAWHRKKVVVIFEGRDSAGKERVMGFATEDEVEQFFHDVPEFERMLVRSGITLIKYWFSITDEEQQMRFLMRIHDPLKQWKLSPMDLQSRVRWEHYTRAKEEMLARTNIAEAPWYIVQGNDKKRARLNCIDHLLTQIPYGPVPHEEVELPDRVFNPNYERKVLPPELYVPQKY